MMSAGVSRYPSGRTEKQADRRARELPGTYRRPLERLDQQVRGTAPGETGALVARLQSFGDLMCLVAGAWGDCSKDLHNLVQICAESKVEHICRSTGRPELEGQLSVIVSQYRRLLSTCIVRFQAQCLISRIGVISRPGNLCTREYSRLFVALFSLQTIHELYTLYTHNTWVV